MTATTATGNFATLVLTNTHAESLAEVVNALAAVDEGVWVNGRRVDAAHLRPAAGWGTGSASVVVEGKREGARGMVWIKPGADVTIVRTIG